jgi:hypothetical protein
MGHVHALMISFHHSPSVQATTTMNFTGLKMVPPYAGNRQAVQQSIAYVEYHIPTVRYNETRYRLPTRYIEYYIPTVPPSRHAGRFMNNHPGSNRAAHRR